MTQENLNIKSTVIPQDRLSYNDWAKAYGAGSAYIKPTTYYTGNHFEPINRTSLLNRILEVINSIF